MSQSNALMKVGAAGGPSYTTPGAQSAAKETAVKQIMSLFGLGAAGGFGLRGLMGMKSMMTNQDVPVMPSNNIPHTIVMQRQKRDAMMQPKFAFDLAGEAGKLWNGAKDAIAPVVDKVTAGAQTAANHVTDFAKSLPAKIAPYTPNTHTSNPVMSEWGIPAGVTAAAAGGYGGYKALDWLLEKERQHTGNNELQDAEDEYKNALAAQYRAAMMSKYSEDTLGLHALADAYVADPTSVTKPTPDGIEKQAYLLSALGKMFPWLDTAYSSLPGVGYDRWQAFNGVANTAATGAMLGAGKLTYDWAKGQNKQDLLRRALARRQAARQQLSPPPIIAINEDNQDGA